LDLIELKTTLRTATGNGPARQLRRQGQIPAVLYGPKTESILLAVNALDIEHVLRRGHLRQAVLGLSIDDGTVRTAMFRELQTHPVTGKFLHADFYEVSMDQKIAVKVPVLITGKSIGVENGGMVQVVRRELEVLCLPNAIPDTITIDVTALDMGDSVHVEDIALPEGAEITGDVNYTVVTILSPKGAGEEVEEPAEADEEVEVAEP
jgi:large subunit ribosomal protein L25